MNTMIKTACKNCIHLRGHPNAKMGMLCMGAKRGETFNPYTGEYDVDPEPDIRTINKGNCKLYKRRNRWFGEYYD